MVKGTKLELVDEHYAEQGCDTFKRMRANASYKEAEGFLKYNLDKYIHRSKGQDLEDIRKCHAYLEEWSWWIENKKDK